MEHDGLLFDVVAEDLGEPRWLKEGRMKAGKDIAG
jgi:hypothetical protein